MKLKIAPIIFVIFMIVTIFCGCFEDAFTQIKW